MPGAPLQRGIESLVAELLRAHVLEAVLARPEVRRGLSPEAIERIRRDILDRLKASEEEGREDRVEVEALLESAVGAAGPAGLAIRALLKAGWERLSSSGKEER